ncbi:MAG: glycosyltransferase family 4 protein [Actinomycetaceae bacterium]|nr:glycosyltransferase family 4 protein [Actinomycetaceae bacterium]
MRVAIVTPWFPTTHNMSSGAFVLKDAQAIARAGADVVVIHLVRPSLDDGSRRLRIDGVRTVRIVMDPRNPLSILRARARLMPLLRQADIVHTQAISALEPFVGAHLNAPWVHTEHWSAITSPHTLHKPVQRALPYLLRMERMPDVVVAVCDFLAQPLRQIRGDRPVEIIPCQVPSPPQLAPRRKNRRDLRLISTGALVERKDPVVALHTIAELRNRGVDCSLVWLGDGPLRNQCIELAASLGVDATFPGTVDAATVQREIARADMFFGPTRADNFFVAAAESIVNGRPLVVGATGGQGEYIDPAVGALVDQQDPSLYADAIIDLDKRTRTMDARTIAATVQNQFEPHAVADAYIDLYQRLLTRPEC